MNKTVFLIGELDNISKINDQILKNKNSAIYSLNYHTHKLLDQNQIQNIAGESYLTKSDRESIDQNAFNITTSWYENAFLEKYLIFNKLNLGSLIEMELVQYLGRVFREAMQIIRIIQKEKPTKIISSTFLNKFVEKLGKEMNIDVDIVKEVVKIPSLYHDKINIKFNFKNIPISFTISRKNFYFLKNLMEYITKFFYHLASDVSNLNKKSILLVDFNPIQYDKLLKELSHERNDVVLLNFRRPAIWNFKSFNIIKNSKVKIMTLNIYEKNLKLKISSDTKLFSENLSHIWEFNHIFENFFVIDTYSFWESIKQNFISICESRFNESIKRLILLDQFFSKSNISSILMWAETGQEEKEVLFISKKYGIKSLTLQHALFPNSALWHKYDRFALGFSYPFKSDKQIIWDNFTKQQAISFGHKEDCILVGSPRHDNFFNSTKNPTKGIIVLATTSVPTMSSVMSPFDSYVKFENFIREVCRIVKKIPNKKLLIKPHPHYESLNNIADLIKDIDPQIQIIYDTNLIDLINNCELLITFNNSTIALESIILEKPTISLQFEKWAEEDDIVKNNAILSISNLLDVERGIFNLLYDEKFKNNMKENAQKFLQSFANPGHASQNLAKILNSF